LFKLAVQHTKQQAGTAAAAAAAAAGDAREDPELSRLLLLSPTLLSTQLLLPLGDALMPAMEAAVAADLSSSGSSSSSSSSGDSNFPGKQARASAMFLAVLVMRGFVQVHEAAASIPAAAAGGLAQDATAAAIVSSLDARLQQLMVCMIAGFRAAFCVPEDGILKCTWELKQRQQRGLVVNRKSTSAAAAAAVAAKQEQTAAAAPLQPEPCSSSSSQRVRWQHLLCLYPSRKLVVAFLNFQEAWSENKIHWVLRSSKVNANMISQDWSMEDFFSAVLTKELLAEMQQLYQDALRFCRTITALAPLPVVCNNTWMWRAEWCVRGSRSALRVCGMWVPQLQRCLPGCWLEEPQEGLQAPAHGSVWYEGGGQAAIVGCALPQLWLLCI
jgi:hypothetical protein